MQRLAVQHWLPMPILNILPATLSLILTGLYIALSGHYLWSVALFLGIIAGNLVDVDHQFRGRLRFMLLVIPAFIIVTVSIEWIRQMPVLLTFSMTLLAFSMTYLGALDARYKTIAFGTLVAALYALLIYQPQLPWYVNPVLILSGTLIYQIVSLLVQLVMPNRPVQMNLATSYRRLAEFIDAKADFFDPDEIQSLKEMQTRLADCNLQLINAFNQCREALYRRLEGERTSARTRRQLRDYVIAQDIHERLNSSHVDYQAFAEQWRHTDVIFRIQRMIRLQAQTCQRMAQALEQGRELQPTGRLTRAMAGLKQAIARHLSDHDEEVAVARLIENLSQVNAQIRTLTQTHETNFKRSIASAQVDGFKRTIQILKDNFTFKSRYFRHALRMGLLTFVTAAVVEWLDLNFGYWILLTTIFVIQPNFSATKERLRHRIIGTIMGVLIGSFLTLIHPDALTQISVMVIANGCFFYFVKQNYSLSTMFLTIHVIMGFSLLGIHAEATLLPRLIFTCIGSALAWAAVIYLWPDWRYFNLAEKVHHALTSAAGYLQAIMHEFTNPSIQDMDYRHRRRLAHEKASELSQLVHEMALFPQSYAAEITLAKQLLSQHFRLLSDLSALGAARDTAQQLEGEALTSQVDYGHELSRTIATLDCEAYVEPRIVGQLHREQLLYPQFKRIETRIMELTDLLRMLNSDQCPHFEPGNWQVKP